MGFFLKIMLFVITAACIILAGYKVYLYFNDKIMGSRTLPQLLLHVLLMITINTFLMIGGLAGLLMLYKLLHDV